MPSQTVSSVENNFTKGLITESTGLNFPENAATDCDNVKFEIIGDVTRRFGVDLETGYVSTPADVSSNAQSSYIWNNPGGDSTARLMVRQIGGTLYFYRINAVDAIHGLSSYPLNTVDCTQFVSSTGFDNTVECEYADGNGYLFVYHPNCDPFYVTYNNGNLTSTSIQVKIRDFIGVNEAGVNVSDRPVSLSSDHQYNLVNQGWVSGSPWSATSVGSAPALNTGSQVYSVASGITGIVAGQQVTIRNTFDRFPGGNLLPAGSIIGSGNVTSYVGTSLTINMTTINTGDQYSQLGPYTITPVSSGYITTWNSAMGNYPSNADVWWYFKNSSGVFDPATTNGNITINTGPAPKGHFILNAFNQQRSLTSGISGLTDVSTTARPRTGAWFQGRVWYAGVDANQAAQGDALFYSWTENIYFSQIVLTGRDFGSCYQTNDASSENLNSILPTDGGVITISGSGKIHKLWPISNGLLVFATNGVWFITGSQGIGFAANDYTITQISKIKIISSKSFVDVLGLPYFWNEEGIYQVVPNQTGQLTVEPITVGTILSFFNEIPLSSKIYAKGAYDTVNYQIQWIYRSTNENGIPTRYSYDRALNFNTYNKCFYPYTFSQGNNNERISTINYVTYPTSVNAPDPAFKYGCSYNLPTNASITFAQEGSTYVDWTTLSGGIDYSSYFVTGYKLHGQGQKRFQIPYIYMFSRSKGFSNLSYAIQGIWDYANNRNSGRWSTAETVNIKNDNFDMVYKRHKLRGMGITLQFKVQSVSGYPFDIMGWSVYENINQGV
jgi:hypothetical protein